MGFQTISWQYCGKTIFKFQCDRDEWGAYIHTNSCIPTTRVGWNRFCSGQFAQSSDTINMTKLFHQAENYNKSRDKKSRGKKRRKKKNKTKSKSSPLDGAQTQVARCGWAIHIYDRLQRLIITLEMMATWNVLNADVVARWLRTQFCVEQSHCSHTRLVIFACNIMMCAIHFMDWLYISCITEAAIWWDFFERRRWNWRYRKDGDKHSGKQNK